MDLETGIIAGAGLLTAAFNVTTMVNTARAFYSPSLGPKILLEPALSFAQVTRKIFGEGVVGDIAVGGTILPLVILGTAGTATGAVLGSVARIGKQIRSL